MKNTFEIVFRKKRQPLVKEKNKVINQFLVRYDTVPFLPIPPNIGQLWAFCLKQNKNKC